MICQHWKNLLEDALAERLEGREQEAFEAHARTCAACRGALDEARFAQLVARTAFPPSDLPASSHFFSTLWQSIERERSRTFSWMVVRDLALRFAVGVAIILALMIGINVISGPRLNDNQLAIDTYMEAPGATDAFRDVLIGEVSTNRDQLLQQLLQRDRQQSMPPAPARALPKTPEQKK